MAGQVLKFTEEYDNSIPTSITLAQFTLDIIQQYGDETACVHAETKQSYTYNDIIRLTRQVASGLQSRCSVGKEIKNVAVVLPSSLEYPIVALAINLLGATAAFVNPSQTITEFQHVVKLTDPDLWIATEEFLPVYKELYGQGKPLVLLGNVSGSLSPQWHTWDQVIDSGKEEKFQAPHINAVDHVAFVMFSSGTTGVPKGVTLTDYNLIAARRQNIELTKDIPRSPDERSVVMLPLFHTFGLSSIYDYLNRGLCFVLIPRFTMKAMLETIQEFKITIVSLVPAIAVQLVKHPVEKYYDLSSIRFMFSGAAALGKDITEKLTEKFGCYVFQGYGMTESSLRTHSNFINAYREGSIGIVMPFCESKVVDPDTNQTLGPNQVGEICVKGPLIMKGYVGDKAATDNMIDADGWLHTGDIGYYDQDGYFFITDRMKELIKYKGFQVSPTELEQVLLKHPDVVEAAVIGLPDEESGELPKAFVVKRPKSKVTEKEIAEFLDGVVSSYKKLRGGVAFVNSIPKTSTGKLLRRELMKLASKL